MPGAILRGEMIDDLEDEFFAYWGEDICFLDIRQSSGDSCECLIAEYEGRENAVCFVTNDRENTLEKIKSLGAKIDARITVPVRRVRTQVNPRPMNGNWPPQIVSDVLHWQGLIDLLCRRKLDQQITEVFKSGKNGMLCLVESPKMPYAFGLIF